MKTRRHSKQELQKITDYDDYKKACEREKLHFMKRWGLYPTYEKSFDDCSLHEIEVQLKNMSKEQIPAFIKKEFVTCYELLEVEDNYVRLVYFMDSSFDPAEIDVVLYDAFGDYELGIYKSYHIS